MKTEKQIAWHAKFGRLPIKHGMSHKLKEYEIWKSMRQRCNNQKDKRYSNYGGRGIKVCDRWDDFSLFLNDLGMKPEGYSIERKDVNMDYCPENCCWIPISEQSANSTQTKWMELGTERKHMAGWADAFGVTRATLREHLQKGRSLAEMARRYGYAST